MKEQKWFMRLLVGGLGLAVILTAGFYYSISSLHFLGATEAEVTRTYPGDDLIESPIIFWNQAITIDSPVEEVWPWIAQLGDAQGAFYSYMFIENLIAGDNLYHNANIINSEWQNPQPGTQLIGGALEVYQVEPGQWLLGNSTSDLGWTWLWFLEPVSDSQTRLIVRSRIQPPAEMGGNAVLGFFMDAGGLVMEKNMIQGIQVRASGGVEPAWIEPVEIVSWMGCFLLGLIFGIRFLRKGGWVFLGVASLCGFIDLVYLFPAGGLAAFGV